MRRLPETFKCQLCDETPENEWRPIGGSLAHRTACLARRWWFRAGGRQRKNRLANLRLDIAEMVEAEPLIKHALKRRQERQRDKRTDYRSWVRSL
jgi:hypothetical protein